MSRAAYHISEYEIIQSDIVTEPLNVNSHWMRDWTRNASVTVSNTYCLRNTVDYVRHFQMLLVLQFAVIFA